MISQNFYTKSNLISQFLGGKVLHYPVKNPSITLEWYEYSMGSYETIYTIAVKLFGNELGHLWTYIADNNPPRQPDDWTTGDIIRLPKVIIKDSDTVKTIYGNAATDTTFI